MEKNSCCVGMELTSKSVKLVAGYVLDDLIYSLLTLEKDCYGLCNGLITNDEEVVKTIKLIISEAEEKINISIKEVALVIPPFNMNCMSDNGSTLTISADDVIGNMDILNIITSMKKRPLSEDSTIINVIPNSYFIDSNQTFKEAPIGKISKQISLHASLYSVSGKVVQQFVYCLERAGLKINHKVVAPYASCLYLSTNPQIPDKYILIDMGHSVTTISQVHNRTTIVNSQIIKFGGNDITEQIHKELNELESNYFNQKNDEETGKVLSHDDAENLKIKYGIDKNPNFPLFIKNHCTFDDLSVAIIHSLQKPLQDIKECIDGFFPGQTAKLPVVLIGGTSELNHIESVFADELNLSVVNFSMDTIGARNKGYTSVLGLIKYCESQPKTNSKEQVTSSVSRVEPKRNKKVVDDIL